MNQNVQRFAVTFMFALTPVLAANAQVQPKSASNIPHMVMEDSATPAKGQLRRYVTELRDSLNRIGSVHALIEKARASKMQSVLVSQGRQLARYCTMGAAMAELTTERIEPLGTPDPRGDQALQAYRHGLARLQADLKDCAHFDSLTMAAKPLDSEKLQNIATAATESVAQYDAVRDALLKLLNISLPITGTIYHR